MQTLWFILVGFMLTMYVVLDGFDLGAGAIHLVAARTNDERRTVLRAIGPVWDGNEVWLIAAGGTLFFSFPVLYASSFSGFYLPLMIVLWLLILRGVAVELRGHINNAVWAGFWDGIFFLGSALLAIFFGVAAGNVVRGVSLDAHGTFFEPLWTDFNPFEANPGILDWYTMLIGLLALAALTMHGANYIAVKTVGPLQERARRIGRLAWLATIALTVLGTAATLWVQPAVLNGFGARPWGAIFPLLAVAGLAGVEFFRRQGRDLFALFASGAYLVNMIWSSLVTLYPMVLPARNPANSLTITNASGSQYGLTVGLIWWLIAMALAALYFVFVYRLFWGKVSATPEEGY